MSEPALAPRAAVTLADPPRASLLALLLRNLLATNLADERLAARARTLHGDVLVDAGGMTVTLRFGDAGVEVVTGVPADAGRPRARVRGSLTTFLALSTGGGVAGPVLSGALRIGGNPFVLLRLMRLIRAPKSVDAPRAA